MCRCASRQFPSGVPAWTWVADRYLLSNSLRKLPHRSLIMDFLPRPPLPTQPRQTSAISPHSRHFHSFRHPLFIKHPSPINHIHFCPAKPHHYAVTSSSRVLIYAPKTGKVVKTISRFKDTARSGAFRKDGKLIVAGGEDGLVQVFDVGSRAVLRSMKEHNQSVTAFLGWAQPLISYTDLSMSHSSPRINLESSPPLTTIPSSSGISPPRPVYPPYPPTPTTSAPPSSIPPLPISSFPDHTTPPSDYTILDSHPNPQTPSQCATAAHLSRISSLSPVAAWRSPSVDRYYESGI